MKISTLTILSGAFLSLTIAVATALSLKLLHDKALQDWSLQAKSMALIQALRADPKKPFSIGKPARNKGNGKWTFYLARRMPGANGAFVGVTLIGISTDYYSDFYVRASISTARLRLPCCAMILRSWRAG